MNIRQLEAFKTIMEIGGFTRAAEKLHLSQPAVSKLIILLEHRCGFQLFHRRRNGIVPTAEAEMLYSEVKRVFLGVDSIAARADSIRNFNYGEISLVTFPSLGTRVLPPLLAGFLKAKNYKVTLASRNSWLLVDKVATQGVDLGFGMLEMDRPGVSYSKLCTMEAVCVVPPGHRLASREVIHIRDLENEPFISMVEEDRAQLDIDRVFLEHGIKRNIILKVQLTEACCSFVSAGLGVSIVDPLSTMGFADDELIVRPFEPAIVHNIWFITPSFRVASLGTQALMEYMREALPNRLAALRGKVRGE